MSGSRRHSSPLKCSIPGNLKPESRNPKPENSSPKPETIDHQPQTRNLKLSTRQIIYITVVDADLGLTAATVLPSTLNPKPLDLRPKLQYGP